MNTATGKSMRLGFLAACFVAATFLLFAGVTSAQASIGPKWKIDSFSDTTAAPGEELEYIVEIRNIGDEDMNGSQIELGASLPPGLVAKSGKLALDGADPFENEVVECTDGSGNSLPSLSDQRHVKCVNSRSVPTAEHQGGIGYQRLRLHVEVESGTDGETLVPSFTVEGGGAPPAATVDPTRISSAEPPFGIDAFDNQYINPIGEPSTEAGLHPADVLTSFDFNTRFDPVPLDGTGYPVEPLKDASVELPRGFVGNPTAVSEPCSLSQIAASLSHTECLPVSQVGTVVVRANNQSIQTSFYGPVPVFEMQAPVGVPARFAFNIAGVIVVLDASLRSDGDYGITTASINTSEGLSVAGFSFDLWGDPSSEGHKPERACPGSNVPYPFLGGPTCTGAEEPIAFLRNPTSCEGTQRTVARADSWFHPGVFDEKTSFSHLSPGYPYPPEEWGPEQGFEKCEAEPFSPSLEAGPPAGAQAAEPSGFSFDLKMPQQGLLEPPAISESDLRKAVVTLPAGVRLNPSSADGLGSCSPAQIGLTTPIGQEHAHFTNDAGNCPESSKVGTLSIKTPLLDHEIPGAVYLAQQGQNPFGSLLALYLVAHDPASGVNLKLAGKVELDPATGQIATTFDDNPQLPFEELHLELKSGPRAPLVAPSACGAYAIQSTFTGWSGKEVEGKSSFSISEGCAPQGFSPKLSAGTENPLAGHTSPFNLRLTREDGEGELASLSATLPPGLSGYLRGIPYCPDSALSSISEEEGTGAAQEANPSCPAQSRVGTVTVGAGAGSNPFYTQSGRAYLAGPYKGAPLSLAVIAPAVAGPFDLGSVLVRNALRVDSETAQITAVSDPLPTILHGIPLDLRDVRVELNRPNFTLNPTSCDPMSVNATVTSAQGQSASPSQRFQAADCNRLAFEPKLSLRLRGKTTRRAHPALRAVLTMPRPSARRFHCPRHTRLCRYVPPQANIARAQVTLPHAEFLDQGHIQNVCTQVQFHGAGCPTSSILGHATAYSPLLDNPLTGPVYLMSGFGHKLPDLAADLNGQIRVLLHGKVDTGPGGGIRNTFEVVPDAPVTKFVLSLKGGSKGLIQNSEDLCAHPGHALALFDAHNGKIHDLHPAIRTGCGGKAGRHKKHRMRHH